MNADLHGLVSRFLIGEHPRKSAVENLLFAISRVVKANQHLLVPADPDAALPPLRPPRPPR
jgi:hypothetical protein